MPSSSREARACARFLEASETHSGKRPEYALFGEELRLTIWAKPSPHDAREDEGVSAKRSPMTVSQSLGSTTGQTPSTSIVGAFTLTTTFMLRMRNG